MPHPVSAFSGQSTRVPHPSSNMDIRPLETQQSQQSSSSKAVRSMSITTPSAQNGEWPDGLGNSHIDGMEPRIFPGVVHERIRKGGTKYGSKSENDLGGLTVTGAGFSKMVINDGEGDEMRGAQRG